MLEERAHTCIVFLLFSRCLPLATVRDGVLDQLSPDLIQYACSYDYKDRSFADEYIISVFFSCLSPLFSG